MGRRYSRFSTSVGLLLPMLLVGPASAKAEPMDLASEPYASAIRLLEKEDCAGAWQTLWARARTGDANALRFSSWITFVANLVPPGTEYILPMDDRLGHELALGLYGWRGEFPGPLGALELDLLESVRGGIRYGLFEDKAEAASRLAICLSEHENWDPCVRLAVDTGIVPSFEDYVARQDGALGEAACLGAISRP